MQEHFGLAHVLRSSLRSEGESGDDDTVGTFDRSNLLRLSGIHCPGFEETALELLKKICLYTHRSEKLFLINVNARNLWLRTVIGHANLGPEIWTTAEGSEFGSDFGSDIIIRSNTLPYYPYWTSDCREWSQDAGIECGLGKHDICSENLAADGRKGNKKRLAKGIWLLTLEGGQFIGKTGFQHVIVTELQVLKRISSHPHIIYGFEHPCEEARKLSEETCEPVDETCESGDESCESGDESCEPGDESCESGEAIPVSAFFMEYMAHDLCCFIVERIRDSPNKPPFETQDSVNILLQIAKAMEHMHAMGVVHCGLKSQNILVREIVTPDNVRHYLVKVTDFGSSRFVSTTEHFIAGDGTTAYCAPEALLQRKDKTSLIRVPCGIDVYSFGIVAFEVLTGIFKHHNHPNQIKEKVCKGERPPFPADSVQDTELTSLVENCWHQNPSERPSFEAIRGQLELRVPISGHRKRRLESGEELPQTKRIAVNAESVTPATPPTLMDAVIRRFAGVFNFN